MFIQQRNGIITSTTYSFTLYKSPYFHINTMQQIDKLSTTFMSLFFFLAQFVAFIFFTSCIEDFKGAYNVSKNEFDNSWQENIIPQKHAL